MSVLTHRENCALFLPTCGRLLIRIQMAFRGSISQTSNLDVVVSAWSARQDNTSTKLKAGPL